MFVVWRGRDLFKRIRNTNQKSISMQDLSSFPTKGLISSEEWTKNKDTLTFIEQTLKSVTWVLPACVHASCLEEKNLVFSMILISHVDRRSIATIRLFWFTHHEKISTVENIWDCFYHRTGDIPSERLRSNGKLSLSQIKIRLESAVFIVGSEYLFYLREKKTHKSKFKDWESVPCSLTSSHGEERN